MALKKWAALIAEFADLKHALAHRGGIRAVRVHRLAECDCDGEAEKLRPFPKEAAAAIREDAVPNLIEPHGDDGALCLPRDDFVAALNAEQRAAFREFSSGKMQTISPALMCSMAVRMASLARVFEIGIAPIKARNGQRMRL